ncbi:hypothetical protein ABXT16_11755 [Staphylococcus epidermidis]|uniref:hypothetical protein n=1 Tax=Staphylococcus epidermidis TaxID=1282 RepID=UPI00339AD580
MLAVGSNFASDKSMQRKIVDSGVDLGAMAATTGTSTAIGASVGGPLGAAVGLVAGMTISSLSEQKLIHGKSITDITKDKMNEKVTAIRNSEAWKNTKKTTSHAINNVKHFGTSVSSIFS